MDQALGVEEAIRRWNIGLDAGNMTLIIDINHATTSTRSEVSKSSGLEDYPDIKADDGVPMSTSTDHVLQLRLVTDRAAMKGAMKGMLEYQKANFASRSTKYSENHDFGTRPQLPCGRVHGFGRTSCRLESYGARIGKWPRDLLCRATSVHSTDQQAEPRQEGSSVNIAIIGSGKVGKTLGAAFVKLGHHVVYASRSAERAPPLPRRPAVLGLRTRPSGPGGRPGLPCRALPGGRESGRRGDRAVRRGQDRRRRDQPDEGGRVRARHRGRPSGARRSPPGCRRPIIKALNTLFSNIQADPTRTASRSTRSSPRTTTSPVEDRRPVAIPRV